MPQRTAKFVFAILTGLLLGAPLVTASHGAPAKAEKKCLSRPKGTPPAGSHWYYHTERATKRRCWFIGDAREKRARAKPETSPRAANSASLPESADTQPSIANARAELPLPRARVEPATSVLAGQRVAAVVTDAVNPENDPRANAGDADTQRSVVASRWPEVAGVASTSASPGPSIESAAAPPARSTIGPPAARPAPPAAVAALPLAAADALPTEKPTGSVQMLLIVILGALALAGVLASAIFRLSGQRRNSIRVDRGVNWDSVRAGRPSLSDEARADRSIREPGLLPQGSLPREQRASAERIAHMLARPPRSAAT